MGKYNKKKPNAKLTHSLDTLTMFSEVGMTPPRTGKQVEGLKAVIAEKKEKVLVEQAENVKEAAEHAEQMIAEAKEEIASEEKGTEEPKAEEQAPAEESKEKSDEPKEETKTEEPASEEPAAEESKTEETTPATDA